jgi:hypothetical protein
VRVPDDLAQRWEVAYRRYGESCTASTVTSDQQVAQAVASASHEVAIVWRDMYARSDLPWWAAAAVCAAAEAFEFQARDWNARKERTWPADHSAWAGLQRLPARPQPTPRAGDER